MNHFKLLSESYYFADGAHALINAKATYAPAPMVGLPDGLVRPKTTLTNKIAPASILK